MAVPESFVASINSESPGMTMFVTPSSPERLTRCPQNTLANRYTYGNCRQLFRCRRTMTDETQPTTEWEHSHAVNEGDVYDVEDFGVEMEVVEIAENGDVTANLCPDGATGDEKIKQKYSEKEVTEALADGLWVRSDGKSHELASF